MLFSNSLIRRYTPPTCTLEIWGRRSWLSLWKTHNPIIDFKFKLLFDDPKILDEQQVILEGDRGELQLLCDRVSSYVQNLLTSSPSNLSLISAKAVIPYYVGNSTLNVEPQEALVNGTPEKSLPTELKVIDSKSVEGSNHSALSLTILPSLTPKGLLTHELDCSLLITNQNKSEVLLSISQLFDLANALEEYSLEAESSPNLEKVKPTKKIVIWAITALVALVAVGIPTVGIKWYRSLSQETALDEPSPSSGQSTIKDILPPVPLPPSNTSVPSPILAPSLAQQKKLPPPPGVGQATPPSRNPSIALVTPPKNVLPPTPVVPSAPQRNTIVLTPNLPATPSSSSAASGAQVRDPSAELVRSPSLSTLPTPPRPNSIPTLSNTPTQSANTAYSMPYSTAVPTLPKLPNLPSQTATLPSQQSQSQLAANLPHNQNNAALLDTIPQVTEVREYFQQRWQPPANLKHTLEYRLVLNSDGSIGRIIPLGRTANIYLDRTYMPLLNEPFVSPPPESVKNPQIRLVLSPDKTVKTFLEDNQEPLEAQNPSPVQ